MFVRRKNVVVDSSTLTVVDSPPSDVEWIPFLFNKRRYEYSGDVNAVYTQWGRPKFNDRDDPTNVAILIFLAATPNGFPRIHSFEMTDQTPRDVVQGLVARYQQQVGDILIHCMYSDELKSFNEAEIVLAGLYECLKGAV